MIYIPGSVKVRVSSQPSDIVNQVHSTIMKYISKEETIILAVTAGNVDLANSDAIQISQEVRKCINV